MGLMQNLAAACGVDCDAAPQEYRVTLFGKTGGYFEGIKSIVSFADDCVTFALHRGALHVYGQGLSLGKYCDGDVAVVGDIQRVERTA